MNWFHKKKLERDTSKELIQEVKISSIKIRQIVEEISTVRQAIENDPLPNFPISGFLVGAAPRVVRRGKKRD